MNGLAPTAAIRRVWLWTLMVGAYSSLAVLKEHSPYDTIADAPGVFEAALSAAMGLLLVFRVNRAYERWWEARTLWGALVNASRNLAVKYEKYASPSDDERQRFRDLISSFAKELQGHLTAPSIPEVHRPSQITGEIFAELNRLQSENRISQQQLWMMDNEARELLDICGGCERIRYTLMPLSFSTLVRQCLLIYIIILPWGLVDIFGYWTIPLSMIISYFTKSAEAVATYIEEPFGESEDHLDLDTIVGGINRTVSQILHCEP